MRILFLFLISAFSYLPLKGHDPLSAFFQLDMYEESCLLSINLSQYGSEQALIKTYSGLDLSSIDPDDYKQKLIGYIKECTYIEIDGEALQIGKGAIKLGSHQTDLKFELLLPKRKPKEITAVISCFSENKGHYNFFKLSYGKMSKRVKLKSENSFQSVLLIYEHGISQLDAKKESHFLHLSLAIVFTLSLGIVSYQCFKISEKLKISME